MQNHSTELDILQQATVEGNVIKLPPGELSTKLYDKVAKKLHGIGGRWKGGKVEGFVFGEDPTQLLQKIQKGATINIKNQYQFFSTPSEVADRLVELAEVYHDDQTLEPSAGKGAIIQAIHRVHPEICVDYCELMPTNQSDLQLIPNSKKAADDFLVYDPGEVYDVIVANPPFTNNQDIDHIHHMFKLLKPGGRVVSIASTHWKIFDEKQKEKKFKLWLISKEATIIDLPQGTFKKSGTTVPACIIILNKPVSNSKQPRYI